MIGYMLVLNDYDEIIQCVGMLPRVGEIVVVKRRYGDRKTLRYLVASVEYPVQVNEAPYDNRGNRGNPYDELPTVRVDLLIELPKRAVPVHEITKHE